MESNIYIKIADKPEFAVYRASFSHVWLTAKKYDTHTPVEKDYTGLLIAD